MSLFTFSLVIVLFFMSAFEHLYEYGQLGIQINAICPGTIKTPMTTKMLETQPTDKIPLDRFGDSNEVADLAVFLASDEAKFMSGACITIDGGYTAV